MLYYCSHLALVCIMYRACVRADGVIVPTIVPGSGRFNCLIWQLWVIGYGVGLCLT